MTPARTENRLDQDPQLKGRVTPYVTPGTVERRTSGEIEAYDWRVDRITASDGRHGLVCHFYDLSERDRIEAALIESETMFRATFENAAIGMAHVSSEGDWLRVNNKLCDILGYRKSDLLRTNFQSIALPEDLDPDLELLEELREGKRDEYSLEKRYIRADGSHVWINLTVGCVRTPDGELDYLISCVEDITSQKEAEAHRDLLVQELHHRVKNILSTVTSVASHTIRASEDLPDFRERFLGRLQSISKAHDSIFDTADGNAKLEDIIRDQFRTYYERARDRVDFSGPDLLVGPTEGNGIGIIIHEMLTNALKYGALSVDEGRIHIAWKIIREDDEATTLEIEWKEVGGPAAKPPERQGFGSRLIQTTVDMTFDGTLGYDFGKDGLCCTMVLKVRKDARNGKSVDS